MDREDATPPRTSREERNSTSQLGAEEDFVEGGDNMELEDTGSYLVVDEVHEEDASLDRGVNTRILESMNDILTQLYAKVDAMAPRLDILWTASQSATTPDPPRPSSPQRQRRAIRPAPPPLTVTEPVKKAVSSREGLIKPSQIPMLRLEDLDPLTAKSHLEVLFSQVESCTPEEPSRMEILKSKLPMNIQVACLPLIKEGKISTWAQLKKYLHDRYQAPLNPEEALRMVAEQVEYDVERQDPYTTIRLLQDKYAVVAAWKWDESLLPVEKWIKDVMLAKLPSHLRHDMSYNMHSENTLKQFAEKLHKLHLQEKDGRHRVGAVSKPPEQATVLDTPPPPLSQEWLSMKESLAQIAKGFQDLKRPRSPWCGYCRTRDHAVANCPLKPPRGSCFECLRLDCRKGRSGCPGRAGRPAQ